jgi:hypothetical protein
MRLTARHNYCSSGPARPAPLALREDNRTGVSAGSGSISEPALIPPVVFGVTRQPKHAGANRRSSSTRRLHRRFGAPRDGVPRHKGTVNFIAGLAPERPGLSRSRIPRGSGTARTLLSIFDRSGLIGSAERGLFSSLGAFGGVAASRTLSPNVANFAWKAISTCSASDTVRSFLARRLRCAQFAASTLEASVLSTARSRSRSSADARDRELASPYRFFRHYADELVLEDRDDCCSADLPCPALVCQEQMADSSAL